MMVMLEKHQGQPEQKGGLLPVRCGVSNKIYGEGMIKYATKINDKKSAKVFGRSLPVSTKDSIIICRKISGMNFAKARDFLVGMLSEKRSIDGRFHTNTALEMVKLLDSAASNAEFKGLDADGMVVKASAHEGFTYFRPRRFKMHRRKKKVTHVQVILTKG
jgi:ribosomal protein L22